MHRFSKVHVRDLEDDIWWSGDAETDVPTSAPVTQVLLEEARSALSSKGSPRFQCNK